MKMFSRHLKFAVIFTLSILFVVMFFCVSIYIKSEPDIREVQQSLLHQAAETAKQLNPVATEPSKPEATILIPNPNQNQNQAGLSPENEALLTSYLTHLRDLINRIPIEERNKKILLKTNYPLYYQPRIQDELKASLQKTQKEEGKPIDIQLFAGEVEGEDYLILEIKVENFEDSSFKLWGRAYNRNYVLNLNYWVTPTAYGTWNYRIF